MEAQNAQPASERQKQFIQSLAEEKNVNIDMESLDKPTASRIIDSLLNENGAGKTNVLESGVDHAKLGLVMKLVYNNWRYNINAICSDKSLRDLFKGQVLETYGILLEIEQKATEIFGGGK